MDRLKRRTDPRLLRDRFAERRYCSLDKGGDAPPPPPAAPDPSTQILAQAKATPSYYGPGGSRIYSGDPNVAGSFRADETLSPDQLKLFQGRTAVGQSLLDRSKTALDSLPVGYKFDGANDPNTNQFFTAQKALLDPVFAKQREQLDQRLANQGLPTGSDGNESAADYERKQLGLQQDSSYQQAAADALSKGYSMDIGTRQQNLNEVAQALGGSQLTPVGSAGGGIDTNTAFANQQAGINRQYQGQLAGYNADVASGNNTMSGIATVAAAFI